MSVPRRIRKEAEQLQNSTDPRFCAAPTGDDMRTWKACLHGPCDGLDWTHEGQRIFLLASHPKFRRHGLLASLNPHLLEIIWRHVGRLVKPNPLEPYAGGVFCLDIVLPPRYPCEAPKIRFKTRIWHPEARTEFSKL